jgi:hypothetical protein
MQIKKKTDIEWILDNFNTIAEWDPQGNKHYLVFEDRIRGGQWTLIGYGKGDGFSLHGYGEDYKDVGESFFDEREQLVSFLWGNRAAYNATVKKIPS